MCIKTAVLSLALLIALNSEAMGKQSERNLTVEEMKSERRVALVIGNGSYVRRGRLPNPVNDAKAMAAVLKSCGFTEVIEITDCTRREMREAIEEFTQKIQGGGVGLFYYAGHGVQLNENNYLIPIDEDIKKQYDVEDECISAGRILGAMNEAKARLCILILDACRNNNIPRGNRSTEVGLAKMDAPSGSLIALATSAGKTASDGDAENSPYTSALLRYMKKPLKIEDVFKNVRWDLGQNGSDQVPEEFSKLVGDFYFTLPSSSESLPTVITTVAHVPQWGVQVGAVGGLGDGLTFGGSIGVGKKKGKYVTALRFSGLTPNTFFVSTVLGCSFSGRIVPYVEPGYGLQKKEVDEFGRGTVLKNKLQPLFNAGVSFMLTDIVGVSPFYGVNPGVWGVNFHWGKWR